MSDTIKIALGVGIALIVLPRVMPGGQSQSTNPGGGNTGGGQPAKQGGGGFTKGGGEDWAGIINAGANAFGAVAKGIGDIVGVFGHTGGGGNSGGGFGGFGGFGGGEVDMSDVDVSLNDIRID